jgi:hypothetical protein
MRAFLGSRLCSVIRGASCRAPGTESLASRTSAVRASGVSIPRPITANSTPWRGNRVSLDRIAPYWDDLLRLAGSLKLGRVSAMGIMRTLQIDDRPTRLAHAVAEIGNIDKTIHTLNFIDDETRRLNTLQQTQSG